MGTPVGRLWACGALTAALLASATAQCEIQHFEGYSNGLNGVVMFRQPSFSGTTSGFLAYTGACSSGPNCAQISLERNRTPSGSRALKVVWRFNGNPRAWLRLTTNNTLYYGNPTISFQRRLSLWLYVPSGTPDFYLTLGVRETHTKAACGANGGATGGIEWVGATQGSATSPPIGKRISQKDRWVHVVFDLLGVLFQFGQRGYTRYDLNWDGVIDDADLLQVLFAFGQGC